jgi:hypothetical protein
LPVEPSSEWFGENIQSIASRLKRETSARVALCSLPPIGEDLSSTEPFQVELNRGIEKYSSIIRDVAVKTNQFGLSQRFSLQKDQSTGIAAGNFVVVASVYSCAVERRRVLCSPSLAFVKAKHS